jgi:arginase
VTDLIKLALVLLVDRSGAVLVQLRGPEAKAFPGLWGLPGGHVEPGEAPLAAAERELFEESGLRPAGGLALFSHDVVPDLGVERFTFCGATSAVQADVVLGEGSAMVFAGPESIWDGREFVTMDADVLGRFLGSSEYARIRMLVRRDVVALVVPQWQGSAAAHASRLADGARMLGDHLESFERTFVDVPDGVPVEDVVELVAARTSEAVAQLADRFVVTVGGDCSVDLSPVSAAAERWGDDLAVVWFDAHADMNTPESSPSGAFHGMVLRTLLGEGPAGLVPRRPLRPDQVVLAGTRSVDPGEADFLARSGLAVVAPVEVTADRLLSVVRAGRVYVHVDLDVLDPGVFGSVGYPEPGGLSVGQLAVALRALLSEREVVGVGVAEFMPRSPADAGLAVASALLDELVR